MLGPGVPIMALTATAVPNVQRDILETLKLKQGNDGLHVAKGRLVYTGEGWYCSSEGFGGFWHEG